MSLTAADFIKVKGVAQIAKHTGRKPGAVRMWKLREKLPREVWPELIAAYPDELDLEALKRIELASARALARPKAA